MSSLLFTPIKLRSVEMPNRIVVAPMCQYSAHDGVPNDWHLMHLGQFAVGGFGLVLVEAAGVEPEGRITPGCVGLWSDAQEEGYARIIRFFRDYGSAKIGIQLAHAGRKASSKLPWQGGTALPPAEGGWQTVSSSAKAYGPGWHTPEALGDNSLQRVKKAFVDAAQRAERVGFDAIELHSAHGYLMHQFLTPVINERTDQYGGSLENRMRYPLEIFDAVRAVWPESKPLGVRISASDWVEGGWDLEQSITFAKALEMHGCDFIDVSSGGNVHDAKIPMGPKYQVPFAAAIRKAVRMPVMTVGLIVEPEEAEEILVSGEADMVALARGFLDDPRWGWHAAYRLGGTAQIPPQYARAGAELWRPAARYKAKS